MDKIQKSIFKKYDIRGKYPEEINENVFYRIGRAMAQIWQPTNKIKKIIIGRDARSSSESLFQALAKGLNQEGIEVLDIGLCSSPMLYFAICDLQEAAGVMITASHLGKDFNGLKIVQKNAAPLTQQEMEKIYQRALSIKEDDNAEKKIDKENINVKASYLEKIMSFKKSQLSKMKVVIDCGGGMAALFAREVFDNLENIEPIYLFENIDGSFSGRGSNPLEAKNREEIKKTILGNKADLGIMFDGDADRVVFFDNKGEMINSNFVSALMIKYLAKEGSIFVADIRSSKLIADVVEGVNGKLVISAAGHTEIKKTMRQEKALFGEEASGHYFFRDFWGLDDAMIAALVFLQAAAGCHSELDSESHGYQQILQDFAKKYHILEEVNFKAKSADDVEKILKQAEDKYKEEAQKTMYLDGLSMEFDGWRFNLRASQTEPLLRLNMEADTEKLLQEKFEEISKIISLG